MNEHQVIHVDFSKKKVKEVQLFKHELPSGNKDKLEYFSSLVHSDLVTTVVEGHPDNIIPPRLKGEKTFSLEWSHMFHLPDFEYNEGGISGTLRFGGKPFFTKIVWDAIRVIIKTKDPSTFREWDEVSLPQVNPVPRAKAESSPLPEQPQIILVPVQTTVEKKSLKNRVKSSLLGATRTFFK